MKKFTFNLEKTLRVRSWEEHEARLELGRAVGEKSAIEKEIENNKIKRLEAMAGRFAYFKQRPADSGEVGRPADSGELRRPADGVGLGRPTDSGEVRHPTDGVGLGRPTDSVGGEPADGGGRGLNDFAYYDSYIARLDVEKESLLVRSAEADTKLEAARGVWSAAKAALKTLENLKEKRHAAFKKEAIAEEEKEIDDRAIRQR